MDLIKSEFSEKLGAQIKGAQHPKLIKTEKIPEAVPSTIAEISRGLNIEDITFGISKVNKLSSSVT